MADADYFTAVAQQALWIVALASAPILIPALIAGVATGVVQAATSINEATVAFVVKLIVVGLALLLFGSAIMALLSSFTIEIYGRIGDVVR